MKEITRLVGLTETFPAFQQTMASSRGHGGQKYKKRMEKFTVPLPRSGSFVRTHLIGMRERTIKKTKKQNKTKKNNVKTNSSSFSLCLHLLGFQSPNATGNHVIHIHVAGNYVIFGGHLLLGYAAAGLVDLWEMWA